MAYFDKLNYTLSNEDTRVEYDLLKENASSVFSISGSGARVMPLIARNPKTITVVDLAREQLYLCELRLAAAKALNYGEFLFFLGYRGGLFDGSLTGDSRVTLFKKLSLSPDCQKFWTEHEAVWAPRGFVLLGKWEGHFQKLGNIFRKVLRMSIYPIFEANSLEEQKKLYEKHFNRTLFRNFLRIVASEYVFNKFLYKGHFSGSAKSKTEERPPWLFLDEEFHRLFMTTLVRKNYFLQLLFLGHIAFEEALPLEAQPKIVEQLKNSTTKVNYTQGDLVTLLGERPYDFISLSDTISYLPPDISNQILNKLTPDCPKGTKMVIRSFLKAPTAVDTSKGWKPLSEANQHAYLTDGTGVYQFHIFEKQ